MDTCVFVLEFFTKSPQAPPIRVWSDEKELIDLFIKQHGFDLSNIKQYVIPPGSIKDNKLIETDTMLIVAHMKSNKDSTIHSVITTDELLDEITRMLADDMIDNMMFGETVIRQDIKFVSDIIDIIESMNYASVCDWELIADDLVDRYYDESYYDEDDSRIRKECLLPPPGDTSFVYDNLFHDRSNNTILPFTLEAYVHYFVQNIIAVE